MTKPLRNVCNYLKTVVLGLQTKTLLINILCKVYLLKKIYGKAFEYSLSNHKPESVIFFSVHWLETLNGSSPQHDVTPTQ